LQSLGCLFSPVVFPFLTLTKVDWLKNGLKDHETEVPCCENLQATILPSRLSAFFFILLFYRSNPPAIVHFIDFCEMDNINVNIKYPTYERDIGVNTYRRLRCSKWSEIDFAPTRTHHTDCQCSLVMVFN